MHCPLSLPFKLAPYFLVPHVVELQVRHAWRHFQATETTTERTTLHYSFNPTIDCFESPDR